jgi:hypothetical protein
LIVIATILHSRRIFADSITVTYLPVCMHILATSGSEAHTQSSNDRASGGVPPSVLSIRGLLVLS